MSISVEKLNHFITEIPSETAAKENRKKILYKLASAVCLVAFIAIAAVAIYASLGLIAMYASVGLSLSPFFFVAACLFYGGKSLYRCAGIAEKKATDAEGKVNELEQIRNWKRVDIEEFFRKHQLVLEKLPMDLLRNQNKEEPLLALLPSIASFHHTAKKAERLFGEYVLKYSGKFPEPVNNGLYEERRVGWQILEFKALPVFFEAVLNLRSIEEPTCPSQLKDIGVYNLKQLAERLSDRIDPTDPDDNYFIFNDQTRAPLTCEEVSNLLSKNNVESLKNKLFPV